MMRQKCLFGFVLAFFLMSSAAFAQPVTDAQIVHFLNRFSFGPTAGDIETVRRVGIEPYLEQQLRPDQLSDSPELKERLADLTTLNRSMTDLAREYTVPEQEEKEMSQEEKKEYKQRQHIIVEDLTAAKILRAVASPAQLQEVMTDFWFNHFNVFAEKNTDEIFISSYERDAIRPYALGKFRDLLEATAHHPAMLIYLDNWRNTDPNSIVAQRVEAKNGKQIGINENYAREIMELHTLGVKGGYTQQDVTTLAHILTGWGISEGKTVPERTSFYFEPKRHDFSNQIWFGYTIRGGGAEEVEQVLNVLAQHPATAHHIAYEMAQYFVADEPPQSLVDKLDTTYRMSDGDIAAMLRTLIRAPEFWDTKYTQNKFKPPFRYVVSSLRAARIMPQDPKMIWQTVAQMGERLYYCLTPNGYANTNDQWLNSDALLKRIEFSKKLANVSDVSVADTVFHALGDTWNDNTVKTTHDGEPALRVALLLSSPDFVYY